MRCGLERLRSARRQGLAAPDRYGTETVASVIAGRSGQSSAGRGLAVMIKDQSTNVDWLPGLTSARNSVHFPLGFNPANELSVEVRGEEATHFRGSALRPSGAISPTRRAPAGARFG